jgi:peptide/nickel transport system substrate-binding protein
MINNEIDTSLDLRPPLMKTVVEQNPKVITHTGREAPFGYTDWWPNSLWMKDDKAPFDDPEVRLAINHAIDRAQIVEIGYEGAGVPTDLPFPEFPSLKQYFDAAKPLLEKYPTSAFDPAKTEEIMTAKGYTKDANGLWTKDGATIEMTIYGFDIFGDYGPVLAEQLRNAGFDASFQAPPDAYTRMSEGTANTWLFGHGGAIADVYPTLDLFHSRQNALTGNIKAFWKNDEYDKIVDQMALLPVGDPKGIPLFLQALEIYLREKPELPIVQWLHRIPMNTTYWTGWPTAENPYVNGAFWHKTFPLILHKLQPAT